MGKKKSFVLRLDEKSYEALVQWANDEFRSVNGQLEWIIHNQLRKAGRLKTKNEKSNFTDIDKRE